MVALTFETEERTPLLDLLAAVRGLFGGTAAATDDDSSEVVFVF